MLPISKYAAGSCVTERHFAHALGEKSPPQPAGKTPPPSWKMRLRCRFTETKTGFVGRRQSLLPYDLLGVLKAGLVERVYVPATDECMHVSRLAALAAETGSLFCYPYLGDVTDSVTGDKRRRNSRTISSTGSLIFFNRRG